MCLLIFDEFNLLNSFLLFYFLIILMIYFSALISQEKEQFLTFHKRLDYLWTSFLIMIVIIFLTRYIYQFTSLDYIYEKVNDQVSFQVVMENSNIIGLKIFETKCFQQKKGLGFCKPDNSQLRDGLLPNILLFFFALMIKNYFRLIVVSQQKKIVDESINAGYHAPLEKIKSFGGSLPKLDLKKASVSCQISVERKHSNILQNMSPIRMKTSYLRKEDIKDLNEIFNLYISYPLFSQ